MANTRMLGHVEHHRVHIAVITPPVAQDLFFVSTYETKDPNSNAVDKHGYQRPPDKKRFPEIAKYFKEGDNRFLITPIIVSVRLKKESDVSLFIKLFEANDTDTIQKTFGKGIISVVDGQHRYLGLVNAWEDDPKFLPAIPIVMFFGLSFVQEAELFNIINVTQRKLPKALIETTKGDITEAGKDNYDQKIRRITFSLCRDNDSVWGPLDNVTQINMTGLRDPDKPVTYEGLRRSTSNMFPVELLDRLEALDTELPIRLAKRYWRRVSEACREAWIGEPSSRTEKDSETGETRTVSIKYRIKDLVGVAALSKLGKDIITSQIENKKSDRLEDLVDKLTAVDWEKRENNPWMRSQAGFAGQKDLYLMLHRLVYDVDHQSIVEKIPDSDNENQ